MSENIQVVPGHDLAFVGLSNLVDQHFFDVDASGAPPAFER